MSNEKKLIKVIFENVDKNILENIIVERIKNELSKFNNEKLYRVDKIREGVTFFYFQFKDIKEVLEYDKYAINSNISDLDKLEKSICTDKNKTEEFKEYIFKIVNKNEEMLKLLNGFFHSDFVNDMEKIEFENGVLNKKINIKKFIFGIEENYGYILSKIEKLEFEECIFNTHFNFIENKKYHFNNCDFENELTISNCQTFKNKSLFFNCDFTKKIKINSVIINIELFENCRVESLVAMDCMFNKKIINDSFSKDKGIKYNELDFTNCIVKDEFYLPFNGNARFRDLSFQSCVFENKVSFSLLSVVEDIRISFCRFMDDLILNAPNIKSLKIENTNFSGNVDLGRSKIERFQLISSNFSKNCNFYNTKFIKYNDFSFSTFNQAVNFSKAKFNNINFSDTNFLSFVDFSEIKNIENKQIECEKIQNRKTARILKAKLDEANNIIESNYFYAIEMQKREDELKEGKEKKLFEWLIFKIHGLASNHSQDWLLALFWIFSFTFSFVIQHYVNCYLLTNTLEYILVDIFIFLAFLYGSYLIIEHEKINKFWYVGIFYVIYAFFIKDWKLSIFSNQLNPFSIMTGNEHLTFGGLIYKVIIAYLIYQLIISIRQNTRRK